MNLGIIGLGLIGGSLALSLRQQGGLARLLGYDQVAEHARLALERGLVDERVSLPEVVANSDLLILAIPVDHALAMLPGILDAIGPDTVVMDVGSTKAVLCDAVRQHPNRARFVATHPMSGTENSGPLAAVEGLFYNKVAILCETELSAPDALSRVEAVYRSLGSRLLYMSPADHDEHVGYVSHLSHVISYALATTVLEKEKSTATIFDLAAGGFASTARLAKSSAAMWVPIFLHNAANILPILDTYGQQLSTFRRLLEEENAEGLHRFIGEANRIRRVLEDKESGPKNGRYVS